MLHKLRHWPSMGVMAALYSERLDEALRLAAAAFREERRKGTDIPYLSHLLQVAVYVAEHGGDEEQMIAAVLHDYLEDIEGSSEAELRERFGARVARLVVGLSDTVERPKPPWRQRKESYLAHLRGEPAELKLISTADKLHNARCINRDVKRDGAGVWDRFSASKSEVCWYYRGVVAALGSGWRHALLDELKLEVETMHELAGAEPGADPGLARVDYGPVLAEAVAAAEQAGEILLAEYHRQGGPRGPRGKCPADVAAEEAIRDRLRQAFPDWQFYGEETGETGRASEHHWLVDPNDGTTPFQSGHRGAAVSIALLRGTEPVLGVVLAYAPPVGERDLICWAEGLPLTRNGAVVERSWQSELTPELTMIVSHAADEKPVANSRVVSPARYRAVPSIAYRLALAAVGEGEVAVSLGGAEDFDYAGGHALLIGAGGVLLDTHGQPVSYAPEGGRKRSGGGRVYGGSPALCRELVHRNWGSVFAARGDRDVLLKPRADRIAPAEAPLDRAQGLLLGQLAGDALGAQVEFITEKELRARYPRGLREIADGGTWNTLGGQPTDDSELALALARSLAEAGRYSVEDVAQRYVAWLESGPFDIGNTTRQALSAGMGARTEAWRRLSEAASVESQANGALMRISPLALLGWRQQPAQLLEWARLDATLTHPHPVCQASNAAFVAALVAALRGAPSQDDLLDAALAALDPAETAVRERLLQARSEPPPPLDGDKMGWVLHALHNAFYELLHAQSAEEGLVRTVMRGGDTDTNGAIAGALLGGFHGATGLPARWVQRVLTCRPLPDTATAHPRPRSYWPVDALMLAERILTSAAG